MDFVAIDFETANHRRDSACQLAAVVVRDGVIVDRQKWMIRPRPFYFSPRNIDVHGIRPRDVENEPEFGELWSRMAPFLQDACLVAHNAPFDIGVLVECLRSHDLETPNLQFTCTRLISRAVWPGQSGYGLKRVAERLGIQFRHHDALEDSLACAGILLAAAKGCGVSTLEQLEAKFRLLRGQASAAGYQGAKRATGSRRIAGSQASGSRPTKTRSPIESVREQGSNYVTDRESFASSPQPDEIDVQRLFIRADFMKRLSGQRIVFAGRMRRISQANAEQLAVRLGASLQTQVSTDTDLLVVGREDEPDLTPLVDATNAAKRLNAEGFPIRTISEDEFVALV